MNETANDSLFETITKDEYETGVSERDVYPSTRQDGTRLAGYLSPRSVTPDYKLEWCDFCKGYYIAEYHFGDKGEGVKT